MERDKSFFIEEVKNGRGFFFDDIVGNEETIYEAGFDVFCFLLPRKRIDRITYLGNMLVQLCLSEGSIKNKNLGLYLIQISSALSYLINSTSFEAGEMKDFDMAEIKRKLRLIK